MKTLVLIGLTLVLAHPLHAVAQAARAPAEKVLPGRVAIPPAGKSQLQGNSAPALSSSLEARSWRKQAWLALVVAQHGAATFDAYTTREAVSRKHGPELDPLLRPFTGSAAVYPVIQIGPVLLDYLGHRMMRSPKGWVRRLWWLPQAAATAGFVWSGTHNLGLPGPVPGGTGPRTRLFVAPSSSGN